ncbi:unnamed protein product [Gordionus sp. m RMFG-2023]
MQHPSNLENLEDLVIEGDWANCGSQNSKRFLLFDNGPQAEERIIIHHFFNVITTLPPSQTIFHFPISYSPSSIIPFQSLVQQHTIPFVRPNPIFLPFAHYHSSSSQIPFIIIPQITCKSNLSIANQTRPLTNQI